MRKQRKEEIPALTGLRFFLALWVVMFHQSALDLILMPVLPHLPLAAVCILRTGYAAVGIFFVLSGFILAYNYSPGEPWKRARLMEFAAARVARIFPVYCLGLLVVAPFALYRVQFIGWLQLLFGGLNLALVQAWIPQAADSWNGPGWSLSNEAFFYASFPLAGYVIWRLSRIRDLLCCCGALIAIAMLPAAAAILIGTDNFRNLTATQPELASLTNWTKFLLYNPLLQLPAFCIGIAAARIHGELCRRGHFLVGRGYWLSLPSATAMLLIFANGDRVLYLPVHNGAMLPLYACLVLGLALKGGPLVSALSRPAVILLGNASYALYILHVPAYYWLRAIWVRVLHHAPPQGLGWMALYVGATVGCSCLVFLRIEQPASRYLKRRLLAFHLARIEASRCPPRPAPQPRGSSSPVMGRSLSGIPSTNFEPGR